MNHISDAQYKQYNHSYRRGFSYSHENENHDSQYYIPPSKKHYAAFVLRKIWMNRNLRLLMVLVLAFIVTLAIFAIILLIPLVGKIIDLISQEGLKGLYSSVLGFLENLWNGK